MKSAVKVVGVATALFGTLLGVSAQADAAVKTWVGSSGGDWHNAANWMPRGVPFASDTAIIGAGRVLVRSSVTISNLTLGPTAEIANSGRLLVTGATTSNGLFTGVGSVEVPRGAVANFNIGATAIGAAMKRNALIAKREGTANVTTVVAFQKLNNKGAMVANVASTARLQFDAIENTGVTQVKALGVVTFKDIKNAATASVSTVGGAIFTKIDNSGTGQVELNIISATTQVANAQVASESAKSFGKYNGSLPVVLEDVLNSATSAVSLRGIGASGPVFVGKAVKNSGLVKMESAATILEADFVNGSGAQLQLSGDAMLAPMSGKQPKIENFGTLRKIGSGNSEIGLEWFNRGNVSIEGGTLRLRPPSGKSITQFAGKTTLKGGNLQVMNAEGTPGTLRVEGGVLDGSGVIQGDLSLQGGSINAGFSPGSITINGNYTQTSNGTLNMEIGGTTPGTGYDQLIVNGRATLAGTLSLLAWNRYTPSVNATFQLMRFYSVLGRFSTIRATTATAAYRTTMGPSYFLATCVSRYTSFSTRSTAPVAGARLSSSQIERDAVTLRFDRALLNPSVENFQITINGTPVESEGMAHVGSNGVRLLLTPGTLRSGDKIVVEWNDLETRNGALASSQTILFAK